MNSPISQRIVHGFNRREPWALREIYDKFRAPLFAWVNSKTRNIQDAEDIVADAFRILLEQKGHFDRLSRIKHFLRNSSRNAWLNLRAHRAVERSKLPEVWSYYENSGEDEEELRDIAEHYMKRITGKLDRLPEKSKQIVLLHFSQGMSHAEIARALHISEKTVANRKVLALKKLKMELVKAAILFLIRLMLML
ncbi:MAG TPA: sigma-70 family RNA polymerase sigma factor [Puia sp.]|nr:sigma-70 family RNA polymerase sigma factor [Puia sp.]